MRPVLARVHSACVAGIEATLVRVEADVSRGLPSFATVGLADLAIRESRERVRAAIRNSGFPFPPDRLTVNLAPADLRKEGVGFDLPIALGLLAATGVVVPDRLEGLLVAGELALDGGLHAVRGVLPMALAARRGGLRGCVLPMANAPEAALVPDLPVYAVTSLADAVAFLTRDTSRAPVRVDGPGLLASAPRDEVDFADVRGQAHAKRCLEIAAAGGHHVLLIGPPGTGKTMLARRLPTILPPLTLPEAIEVSQIWSVAGLLPAHGLVVQRPFRAPHHSVSAAGLVGGGRPPQPGEASLGHLGVLFLDEVAEFAPHVLDTLRQPLEEGCVTIARAGGSVRFPAEFQFVAATNFCRRGCRSLETCVCPPADRARYLERVSAPLLDRIDLHVDVPPVAIEALAGPIAPGPAGSPGGSVDTQRRVIAARERQHARFGRSRVRVNGRMTIRHLARHCLLPPVGRDLLVRAVERLGLSGRAHDRVLKIARTIADLADRDAIEPEDVAEALQYRVLDRLR